VCLASSATGACTAIRAAPCSPSAAINVRSHTKIPSSAKIRPFDAYPQNVYVELWRRRAQIAGAFSQFEKARLVSKLRSARERKKAEIGRCEGRRTYAEAIPQTVAPAKRLRADGLPYRKIATVHAEQGHVTGSGKAHVASAIQKTLSAQISKAMLRRGSGPWSGLLGTLVKAESANRGDSGFPRLTRTAVAEQRAANGPGGLNWPAVATRVTSAFRHRVSIGQ
jgi:hypothetical protein